MLSRSEVQDKIKNLNQVEALNVFLDVYKDLPVQGSEAWRSDRKIGGSAVGPLLGHEKFNTIAGVAHDIVFPQDIKSPAMLWGNIFEEVAKKYLSSFIQIKEFGCLPGFEHDGKVITSYSPDGVFIMTEELAELLMVDNVGEVCLLEIKCPYARFIGEIPSYYYPQMNLGMETFGFIQKTLFADFLFRMCSIQDFNFSTSSKVMNSKSISTKPIAIGFIGFHEVPPYQKRLQRYDYVEDPHEFDYFQMCNFIHTLPKHLTKIERYVATCKCYPQTHVNAFFGLYYPHIDLVDFGGTENFVHPVVDNMEFIVDAIKSNKHQLSEVITDDMDNLQCKLRLIENSIGLKGVMCYKLFGHKLNIVKKTDFSTEIQRILTFGVIVQNIRDSELFKNLNIEDQKKYLLNYDFKSQLDKK